MPTLRVTGISADLTKRLLAASNASGQVIADIAREAIERGVREREEQVALQERLAAMRRVPESPSS
jgi:predicted DNA-binding protein